MWVAPAKGSGCVRLSAMIYEGKDAWYADAGGLTKIVCEQKADMAKKVMSEDECCACDEAKYNVSAHSTFGTFVSLFCRPEYISPLFLARSRITLHDHMS
jgi:hypothetical protein